MSIFKFLRFLNLLDRTGRISLTNLSLYVILTKIAVSPFDWTGAAVLLPVIASYMQKRYESNKFAKNDTEIFTKIQQEIKNLTKKE